MATSSISGAQTARSLCEQGRWPDVLAFAQQWQAENPDEARAFFHHGVALAALALDDQDFKFGIIWRRCCSTR